jgi:hypothetical protein
LLFYLTVTARALLPMTTRRRLRRTTRIRLLVAVMLRMGMSIIVFAHAAQQKTALYDFLKDYFKTQEIWNIKPQLYCFVL